MENKKILHQVVDSQKVMFDNSFAIMETLQDQGWQAMDLAMSKNVLLPEGSQKLWSYWIDFLKQNQKNCKDYVDSGLDRTKEFIEQGFPSEISPVKERKTSK